MAAGLVGSEPVGLDPADLESVDLARCVAQRHPPDEPARERHRLDTRLESYRQAAATERSEHRGEHLAERQDAADRESQEKWRRAVGWPALAGEGRRESARAGENRPLEWVSSAVARDAPAQPAPTRQKHRANLPGAEGQALFGLAQDVAHLKMVRLKMNQRRESTAVVRPSADVSGLPGPGWADAKEAPAACYLLQAFPPRSFPLQPCPHQYVRAGAAAPTNPAQRVPSWGRRARESRRAKPARPATRAFVSQGGDPQAERQVPQSRPRSRPGYRPCAPLQPFRPRSGEGWGHKIHLGNTGAADRPCLRRSSWSG